MLLYQKEEDDYILIANTSFGVLVLKADNLESYRAIESPERTNVAGVPFDKIENLKNVRHLARLDENDVLVMTGNRGAGPAYNPGQPEGPINPATVALP